MQSTSVKSNLQVFRAKFSEITPNSIRRACETLMEPDCNISDAVDVRQELDLRIGTELIFTSAASRAQTPPPSAPPAPIHSRSLIQGCIISHRVIHALVVFAHAIPPSFLSFRCLLHSLPDPPPAEDLPGVAGQSADFLRQLSVSHSGLRGGAIQSHPGFHTRDFLQDQRYLHTSCRDAGAEVCPALPTPHSLCPCFFGGFFSQCCTRWTRTPWSSAGRETVSSTTRLAWCSIRSAWR